MAINMAVTKHGAYSFLALFRYTDGASLGPLCDIQTAYRTSRLCGCCELQWILQQMTTATADCDFGSCRFWAGRTWSTMATVAAPAHVVRNSVVTLT